MGSYNVKLNKFVVALPIWNFNELSGDQTALIN